jgi:3-oxoacyl-[acyl-carrier protein] reductase
MLQSAHVTPRKIDSVVKSLAAKGVVEWGEAVNVADPVALQRWVESAAVELAGIDIFVCNVSALAVGNTPETWENSFRVDMMQTVSSVAAALPFLGKSKSAS